MSVTLKMPAGPPSGESSLSAAHAIEPVDVELPSASAGLGGYAEIDLDTAELANRLDGAVVPAEAPPPEAASRLGVLRHRHFRNVWGAALVSNTGNWMEMVAIQMIVAHVTGSMAMLGYLAAAQLAPILLLGVVGGMVADRVNRKRLLATTQFLLMFIAAAIAVLAWMGYITANAGDRTTVPLLMWLSALQGVVLAFNIPAWQVMTPRLVPKDELTKAITLNGIQFNMARVIGPAAAGMLMGQFGPTPLLVINAFTFVVVVVAVLSTPDAPAPAHDGTRAGRQLALAWRFIFGQRGPLCVLAAMVLMSALAAPLVRMLPLFAIDVYGLVRKDHADQAVGWLLAVLGVGAVLGGLGLKWVPAWYPKHHFIPTSLLGAGISITAFSLTHELWFGLAVMLVVGVFWIWGFNQAWAAMQHLVPDAMRGRVMAISSVASFGATAVGNLAAGWLGDGLKGQLTDSAATQTAVGGLSGILLLSGLVMLIWRVPEIDGLKPGDPEYGPRRNIIDGLTARRHRPVS